MQGGVSFTGMKCKKVTTCNRKGARVRQVEKGQGDKKKAREGKEGEKGKDWVGGEGKRCGRRWGWFIAGCPEGSILTSLAV